MQNWYAIETESALRRHQWQREVEQDMRASAALAASSRRPWPALPSSLMARLRGLSLRLLFTPAMKAECRTAICL